MRSENRIRAVLYYYEHYKLPADDPEPYRGGIIHALKYVLEEDCDFLEDTDDPTLIDRLSKSHEMSQ